jgi:hypothetical protein
MTYYKSKDFISLYLKRRSINTLNQQIYFFLFEGNLIILLFEKHEKIHILQVTCY